ncbi:MAG TPA: hypothetical protein VFN96_00415, partial [Gemmatimonadales bacterium]|nr:hypothetical protein [Gemmatimonadales bacterium]
MIGKMSLLALAVALAAAAPVPGPRQQQQMTFFITSRGPGNGAALGGLEGADAHCATLAREAG